jgi:hypothetical protein
VKPKKLGEVKPITWSNQGKWDLGKNGDMIGYVKPTICANGN